MPKPLLNQAPHAKRRAASRKLRADLATLKGAEQVAESVNATLAVLDKDEACVRSLQDTLKNIRQIGKRTQESAERHRAELLRHTH